MENEPKNKPDELLRFACLTLLALLFTNRVSASTGSNESNLPSDQQVFAFVTESVDWYRHSSSERQIATEPVDLLFLYDNQPIATQIVRLSFDFARADASLGAIRSAANNHLATTAIVGNHSPEVARLTQLENKTQEAIAQVTEQTNALTTKLHSASRSERKKLQAALDETRSRLELLQAGAANLSEAIEFLQTSATADPQTGNLVSTIDDLARTVPDTNSPPAMQSSMQTSGSSSASKPTDPGILGLASELSALLRKLRILDEQRRLTDSLAISAENLRVLLIGFINNAVQGGDMNGLQASDFSVIQQQTAQLEAVTAQLKALSPAIIALDKQKVLLGTYESQLKDWRAAVISKYESVWKNLILRLAIVVAIISTVLCAGSVLRKVARTHVHDANRLRIILAVQRVVIWSTIVFLGIFAFAAGFSSIATFFGLVTAGVAVALQSVIVASLGYFVLVGRHGIKVGDRVQISGVTGDVVDINLLQFQLREFDRHTQQLTENVVTFSNSFIFVSPATGLFRSNAAFRAASHPEASETP